MKRIHNAVRDYGNGLYIVASEAPIRGYLALWSPCEPPNQWSHILRIFHDWSEAEYWLRVQMKRDPHSYNQPKKGE